MHEIADGIHHWTAFRDTIRAQVSSYWVEPAGVVIDPMVPEEGLDAFAAAPIAPQQVVLTTGLHMREADRFVDAFGIPMRAPREARARLGNAVDFRPYRDHEEIAPGVHAVHIGVLAPDEYALHVEAGGGAIVLADAIHHYGDALSFFADDLLGHDPQAVKDGIKQQLQTLLQRDFEHLLFAHGAPIVRHGKRALRAFVESPVGHEDFGQAL